MSTLLYGRTSLFFFYQKISFFKFDLIRTFKTDLTFIFFDFVTIKVKKCFSNFKSNDGHKVPKTISSLSFAFFLDLTLNSKNKKNYSRFYSNISTGNFMVKSHKIVDFFSSHRHNFFLLQTSILYNDEENEIEKIKITKISPFFFRFKLSFFQISFIHYFKKKK